MVTDEAMNVGGLLLGRAADLADHHDGPGVGVGLEGGQAVDEAGAGDRVAADAHAGGLAHALLAELVERLVGQVPERLTMPTGPPAMAMSPEVIPMLHFPGEMMPGQFGPSSRVPG